MNEWAILNGGAIVNVVYTHSSKAQVQKAHPGHEVELLWNLPSKVQQAYRYWDERP